MLLVTETGVGEGWMFEEYCASLRKAVEAHPDDQRPRPFVLAVLAGNAKREALPQLLRHRTALPASDLKAIATAILRHTGHALSDAPALGELWRPRPKVDLELELSRQGDVIEVTSRHGRGRLRLPTSELASLRARIRPQGVTRDSSVIEPRRALDEVGQQLGGLFAGSFGEALARELNPSTDRGDACVRFRATDSTLLSLPWEAAHLGTLGPLGLIEGVALVREIETQPPKLPPLPKPLRILVALAAPGDDLDQSKELGVILDGVEDSRFGRARVVFVDEGAATLQGIREQLDVEPFHVLHLSAHGRPGELTLESAEGHAVAVSAEELGHTLVESRHPPRLVVLSACSSGNADLESNNGDSLHVAEVLLRAGVPQVVAMQGPVGDGYATELARHLYRELATQAEPLAADALGVARRAVERERREHARKGEAFSAPSPEFATPALYAGPAASQAALYDGTRPPEPTRETAQLVGVPGLALRPPGWLVGRRALRRKLCQVLTSKASHGAVLTGAGGIGKSSLAASVAERLVREGWGVVALVGAFSVADIALAAVQQLGSVDKNDWSQASTQALLRLATPSLDERVQLAELRTLLSEERVVLLLDNFEDNLMRAESGVPIAVAHSNRGPTKVPMRESAADILRQLTAAAQRGALLLTSRYAVAGLELEELRVGPLEPAPLRQLVWRLPGLLKLDRKAQDDALNLLGGHPRALEFADALLRTEPGRWQRAFHDVQIRLERLAATSATELPSDLDESLPLAERLALAQRLASEDILLEALLATLDPDTRHLAAALAVFRRGVPIAALEAVGRALGLAWDGTRQRQALHGLLARTLVADAGPGQRIGVEGLERWPRSYLLHRFTADALLKALTETERRAAHAGAAAWWLVPKTLAREDALEGVDHLAAAEYESASDYANLLRTHAERVGQNLAALSLCEHLVEQLPPQGYLWAAWQGMRGQATIARDEAAHAELAWDVLDWCLKSGGSRVTRAVARAARADAMAHTRRLIPRGGDGRRVYALGHLTRAEAAEADAEATRRAITRLGA